MYAPMTTCQHGGASFNESVVWFMYTPEIFAVGYTHTNALWRAAKIHGIVNHRALDGTIQTEQPRAADAATT
jgi:hypothetical protein